MLSGMRATCSASRWECEIEEKEATGIRDDYKSVSRGESDWKRQRRKMRGWLNQESGF